MANSIYGYEPSPVLNGLAISVFSILFVIHISKTFSSRGWYTLPLILCCLLELLSYVFRSITYLPQPTTATLYVTQFAMLGMAPITLGAVCQMSLARVLRTLDANGIRVLGGLHVLKARRIIWGVSVTGDIIVLCLLITGSAIIGTKVHRYDVVQTGADHIILAGFAIQLVFFCTYTALYLPTYLAVRHHRTTLPPSLKHVVNSLGLVTICLGVRLAYRVASSALSTNAQLRSHEAYLACLDFVPVVLALTLFALWHPGQVLRRPLPAPKMLEMEVRCRDFAYPEGDRRRMGRPVMVQRSSWGKLATVVESVGGVS